MVEVKEDTHLLIHIGEGRHIVAPGWKGRNKGSGEEGGTTDIDSEFDGVHCYIYEQNAMHSRESDARSLLPSTPLYPH